jgi:hypothetical protein
VQTLPSSQTIGFEPTQVPASQASVCVQTSPSVQVLVSSFVVTQLPSAGLQLSSVQELPSSQDTGLDPTHVPASHASDCVHASPSVQVLLSSFVVTQLPSAGLQLSSVQALPSSHTTGFEPAHVPASHASVCVQASPSVQALLSSFVYSQPDAGLHVSSVQALPSSQVSGFEPVQAPATQVSVCVQASLSSQAVPSRGTQVSLIHDPAAQVSMPTEEQPPDPQVVGCVRPSSTFPSQLSSALLHDSVAPG